MKKKVVVVGVGALGSHLTVLIRNHADLKVVDFDRVEAKNVMSQFHTVGSVGKNKAMAMQQLLSFLFGKASVAVPHRLTELNVREVLSGAELVVDCVDNGDTRRLIQAFCLANDIPCLHGAVDGEGTCGQARWTERFRADDGEPGAATCEDGEHLPFIAHIAAGLAQVAKEFIKTGRRRSLLLFPGGSKEL